MLASVTRAGRADERPGTSIGAAERRPGTAADELLGAADSALLHAKDQGGGIVAGAGGVAARAARDAVWGGDTGAARPSAG